MARKTIPNLPATATVSSTAQIEIVQDGVTYRASAGQIANIGIGITGPAGPQGPTGAQGPALNVIGFVAIPQDLPMTNNKVGDAYVVQSNDNLYVWNGSTWIDIGSLTVGPTGPTGATGTAGAFYEQTTAPTGALNPGDRWFDTSSGVEYTWITDAGGGQWVEIGSGGIGPMGPTGAAGPTGATGPSSAFYEQSTGPTGALNPGDRWFDTSSGIQYTWITDAGGGQWVEVGGGGGSGATGPTGPTGAGTFTESSTPPVSPTPIVGDRWFDTSSGIEYTYISDAGGNQWVELNAGSVGPTGPTGPVGNNNTYTESSTPPVSPAPVAGDRWVDINSGILYTYFTDAGGSQWVQF